MLPQGATTILAGPSGSGKSTLLKLLAGIELPDAGKVSLKGQDITFAPALDRPVAWRPQNAKLYGYLDVADNVAFSLRSRGFDPDFVSGRVASALKDMGLTSIARSFPSQLSSGARERVLMARLIARQAELYLIDEPLGGFSIDERKLVLEALQRFSGRAGSAVLLASQGLGEMVGAFRVVRISEGRVV